MARRTRWWLAALATVMACRGAVEEDAGPAPPARSTPSDQGAPLPVAVGGCDHLLAEPRCLRDGQGPITLWMAGEQPASALEVSFDGVALGGDGLRIEADEQGVLVVLVPPAETGRVALVHEGRRFELAVAPLPAAFRAARAEVLAVYERESVDAARVRLAELRATLPPLEAHLLDTFEPKLAYGAGDWRAVMAAPQRLGAVPESVADIVGIQEAHVSAVWMALHVKLDFEQAQAHIDALKGGSSNLRDPIMSAYLAGVLAHRLGRLDESIIWLDRAADLARRTGQRADLASALVEKAVTLADLGRFVEAEALSEAALGSIAPDDPFQLEIGTEVAWVRILHREYEPGLPDPSPFLLELVERADRAGDVVRANGVRLNLAIAASQGGDHARAEQVLREVERDGLNTIEQVFAELVLSRIAAHRTRLATAREHLERARLLAELVGDDALVLRARLARAELERRTGDRRMARHELEQAEAIEDRLALGISPQAGRSTFSTARRHDRAGHLELLLALGDRPGALCTVLGARARHLRSLSVRHDSSPADPARLARQRELLARHRTLRRELEQRTEDSWRLSVVQLGELRERTARDLERLDALAREAMALVEDEPKPWSCSEVRSTAGDRALLTMHPGVDPGTWVLMLDRVGEVELMRLALDPPLEAGAVEQAADRALAELRAGGHFTGVTVLTVVPLGELATVDFHALGPMSDEDAPLVVYGLGLGRVSRAASTDGSIAVIAGGRADLREPQAEVEDVRAAMEARGWALRDTWAPDDARQPTLLHYAGHGRHAGPMGWDSELDLADGPLTAEQIIAYQRAPTVVVLGACDAATTDARVLDGGMNIAAALLLAGSELVIAPDGPVDDHEARALAQALYRELPTPQEAAALGDALVRRLSAAQKGGRFREWRAWGP